MENGCPGTSQQDDGSQVAGGRDQTCLLLRTVVGTNGEGAHGSWIGGTKSGEDLR